MVLRLEVGGLGVKVEGEGRVELSGVTRYVISSDRASPSESKETVTRMKEIDGLDEKNQSQDENPMENDLSYGIT
jgi:hypothetical protein